MISEASVFWDSVVILKKQSKQKVIDREKKKDFTFPVSRPPARDEYVVVPRPYFLYK